MARPTAADMNFPSGEVAAFDTFTFRERKDKCDWRRFSLIDLDSVKHNKDIATLKEHIAAVTFSLLEEQCNHCQHPINAPLLKLTRMAQLSLEWLLHCYQHVCHSLKAEQKKLAAAVKKCDELREKKEKWKQIIEENKKKLAENSKELKHRRQIIFMQQQMFKPASIKCPECDKAFINAYFVRSHMQRVHHVTPQLQVCEEKPDTAPIEALAQEMNALRDRIAQEQNKRDSERKKKFESLRLENEHLSEMMAQLLKQQSRSDMVEETREEAIKQEVDNFKDWFTREFKPEALDRMKTLQLEIDRLNGQVLLLQKELEASDAERKSENKQAKLEVEKLEEQLHKEQLERIAQVENSKWQLFNQKQLQAKAIQKLKNKLEIQWESRLQDLRTRLEAEKTELLNKLVRMMDIEWRRQRMLYVEDSISSPSSKQHSRLSALRSIFKSRQKKPWAASTKEAVGQIVCENVIRMLVSLGADPDQRGLYKGQDLDQCRQITSIVQQVLDDQRSHAALLAVSQEGPPLTPPLPEAPDNSFIPTIPRSSSETASAWSISPASQSSQSPVPRTRDSGAVKEEEQEEQEDRPQNKQTEAPVRKEVSSSRQQATASAVGVTTAAAMMKRSDEEEEDSELKEPRPASLQDPDQRGSVDQRSSGGDNKIRDAASASEKQRRRNADVTKPPAGGARISPEKIKDQRTPNEEHAKTPDDKHRSELIASNLSSLLDSWYQDTTQSLATSRQSNEVSQKRPPLPRVHQAPEPRKRASKAGTTTTPETPKSSPRPTILSSSSETASAWSISPASQSSQSPVPRTRDCGAVKEEEQKEQEDRPQNKQTEVPVRKEVSSSRQQATASAVGVTTAAAMMKSSDEEEEDSELKEPRPASLQEPDQRGSVDQRSSGGEDEICDVPTRTEKQGKKTPSGVAKILPKTEDEGLYQDWFFNIQNKTKEESPPAQGSEPTRARLDSTGNKISDAASTKGKQGETPPEKQEGLYRDRLFNIPNTRKIKEESPPAQGSDPTRDRQDSDPFSWPASTGNKISDAALRMEKQGEKPPKKKKEILGWDDDFELVLNDILKKRSKEAQVNKLAQVAEAARKKVTCTDSWGSQTTRVPSQLNDLPLGGSDDEL